MVMGTQVLDYPLAQSRFHPKCHENKATTNTGSLILFSPLWLHEHICVIPSLLLHACMKVVLTQKAPILPLAPNGAVTMTWADPGWGPQVWGMLLHKWAGSQGEQCWNPLLPAAPALPMEGPWLLWAWFPAAAISPPWDKLHPWVMVCGCCKKNLLHQAGQQIYCTTQQQWQWKNLALNYLYWTQSP